MRRDGGLVVNGVIGIALRVHCERLTFLLSAARGDASEPANEYRCRFLLLKRGLNSSNENPQIADNAAGSQSARWLPARLIYPPY